MHPRFFRMMLLAIVCCLMLIPTVVNAVTISYEGYASQVLEISPSSTLLADAGFSVGDRFTIAIDYDENDTTPDSTGADWAKWESIISSFAIEKVGYEANYTPSCSGCYYDDITMYDGTTSGTYDTIGYEAFAFTSNPSLTLSDLEPYYLGLNFSGPYGAFSGFNLPSVAPNPADYNGSAILQFYYTGSDEYLSNYPFVAIERLTEAQSSPVPEPATMLLLGTGLIGLAGFKKELRKRP